jgi:hypothetical protein
LSRQQWVATCSAYLFEKRSFQIDETDAPGMDGKISINAELDMTDEGDGPRPAFAVDDYRSKI